MVCEWGMSEKLGPLTFGKKGEEIFLGRDFGMQRDYSEAIAQTIDEEIKRFVELQGEQARKLVTENRDKLTRIAEALLEHESLDASAVDALLQDPKPAEVQPAPQAQDAAPGV
jgi:cell division protease FtsH